MPGHEAPPDLDAYIAASRHGKSGPCGYVEATTPEQREQIDERIAKNLNRWAAFRRWLLAQDVDVSIHMISAHYKQSHLPDE